VPFFGGAAEYLALRFKSQGFESGFYYYASAAIFCSLLVYFFFPAIKKTSMLDRESAEIESLEEELLSEDFFVWTPQGRLFARYWSAGAGSAPIILFHDSLGSVELWRDFPELLSQATGRSVLAYDRLGFGRSDPREGKLEKTFVVAEALNLPHLRARFAIEAMILFGHSVGGAMAVSAGARFPGETAAVITEAAQAFVEDRTLAGIRAAQAAFQQPSQFDRLRRYHGDKARWVLDAWTQTWFSQEFADWTLDDQLVRLQCPILAMHGEHDEYGALAHPLKICELARHPGQAVILRNCGHIPHREKPDEVLAGVTEFLCGVA